MVEVKFYDNIKDELLEYAVIVSRHNNKWVLCKHSQRDTYECPGGHREKDEKIENTAKRELWEETGAQNYEITPICVYSMCRSEDNIETFGMLYYANILTFGDLPQMEIEKVEFLDELPTKWTYPIAHPLLIQKVVQLNYIHTD